MIAPDDQDVSWAYTVLDANEAVRLSSSLESLWADRPRNVSLEKSRDFTGAITRCLADSAFMLRDDFALPQAIRLYGIHDIVLNCLCADRPERGTIDIVFFSGVVSAPLLRFAVQIMLSRLEDDRQIEFPDGSVGGLHELAECALAYTVWQLVEDVPITLSDFTEILTADDLQKLVTTMDGLTQFLFLHEVGHIACNHIELQRQIVQFSEGRSDYRDHEFEADAFAIRCIKPEYRSPMVLYARIFLEIIADLETMGFDFGLTHPKATARVRNLLDTFDDDIDELRKRLLKDFLDNREGVQKGMERGEVAGRDYASPAGAGRTRSARAAPGDRLLKLPAKSLSHFALETLISAYRARVAEDHGLDCGG